MKVFYVNIGGGEPMLRPDFFDLLGYAVEQRVGVKFPTNGTRLTAEKARRLAAMDYVDVQISLDGAVASTNDAVRGEGSFGAARRAMEHLAEADFGQFKISVVVTRENVSQLDSWPTWRTRYGAQLRLTRFRPSGRGAETWEALHPTAEQQRMLYHWLRDRPGRLDRRLLLPPLGPGRAARRPEPVRRRPRGLPDRPGRATCTPARLSSTRNSWPATCARPGGFAAVWRESELFQSLREPQSAGACASCGSYDACQGGCMAAKFFTGIPWTGRTPNASSGTGRPRWRPRRAAGPPRAWDTPRSTPAAPPIRCPPRPVPAVGPRLARPGRAGRCRSRMPPGPRWRPAGRRQLLAIPIGSLEQHGPHLPLNTETRIATALAARLGGHRRDVMWRRRCPTGPVVSTRRSPGPC